MTAAIIVAAGRGLRMGGDVPKQYLPLGKEAVIERTLRVFDACPSVDALVWVAPEADLEYCRLEILGRLGMAKPAVVCAGGRRRQDSVHRGLLAAACLLQTPADLVAIHDGVRPFVTIEQVETCIARARETGACILGLPVFETLKTVDPGGRITATRGREGIWAAQTPQVFRHDLILEAHRQARRRAFEATDDAQLVERLGIGVSVVVGSRTNFKITTPEDLSFARLLAVRETASGPAGA